jgi:DNA invertase Pin-like site-specific DNA recombinase
MSRIVQPSPWANPPPPPPPEPEPEPEPQPRKPRLTRAQKARIFRLAATGARPAAIERQLGIHRKTVARVLRNAGKLPPPSGRGGRARSLTPTQAAEAAARKAAGETWPAIAASYSVSEATVKRAIARLQNDSTGH